MIINKLVFPIKSDLSFVEGGIPQGKLTANSINRDILYVISPAVKGTVITAFFQNQKQTDQTQQATFVLSDLSIDYLVSKDTSYYELVKDWNVWQTTIPSKALEFISYNRAGKIGISFAFRQLLEPSGFEGSQEIKSDDFVINNSGSYIIKIPYYHFLGNDFTYNDVLIYNGGSEVYRKPAIALQGTTGTLEYSVDPSVYMDGYELIDISLTESILSKLQILDGEVIRVEQKADAHIEDLNNPHGVTAEQVDTYVKTTIDNKDADILQEAKDYTDILGVDMEDRLDESIDTHNESATSHEDIRLLISTLNDTKLNKDLTLLVEEASLTLSDLFVVGKGSDTRKVSLAVIATYLSTSQIQLFTIVEELPTENQNPNTIYLLVTENVEGDNQLLEYIWIEDEERFELIGNLEVDLSNYFNKSEINSMLDDKVEISDIVNNLTSTDTNKPLSANQGKVLNDTTAKLAVSNVFTQPQQVPSAVAPQDAVNKSQLDNKVDKITQEQRDSLGFMENDDRIISAVDKNLNEMPIKATINKEESTIVVRNSNGDFQDLYDHNTNPTAHSNEFNSKQDKLVAGDNITIDETTNVISASIDWQEVENKPELYNKGEINSMLDGKADKLETYSKTEIDTMIGDIDSILDSILGV